MTNRRKFIKQIAAAGVVSSIPSVLFSQQESNQPIRLLVRADDMGNSWGRTVGMIKAYKEGIVTSASIMPPSQFFEESVQLCKENPSLTIGLHITLLGTRTRSVLSPEVVPSILTPNGFFYETIDELNNANPKMEEVEKEISAQIGKARASGLHFVYLDWHRAVHYEVIKIMMRICNEQKLIYGQDNHPRHIGENIYGFIRVPFIPESFPSKALPDGQRAYYAGPALTQEDKQLSFERLMLKKRNIFCNYKLEELNIN